MATTNKKITYNSDFKLKVLEHYLKNGGDAKYGLKTKTCARFNINKKTINRLLENPEMIKRAKKLIKKGTPVKAVKPGSKSLGRPVTKPSSKAVAGKQSSSVNSKVSSTVNTSYGTSGTNKQKASGHMSNTSNNTTTDKTSRQANFSTQNNDKGKENVTLFDIPENPDFSILKRPINSSASNNASSIARLLVTGTKEVQNMLLNECEIIFECKVCRNLFRSIVNFLAHKRIYCRDNFTQVKSFFHKDDLCGLTTQSSTVVVEPEPPPESSAHKESWATSDNSFSWRSRNRRRRIDNIADNLSRKNKDKVESSPTSSSDKGSSHYHQRIENITAERAKLTRECFVTLENITGVDNAIYQTYTPPDTSATSADYEATYAKIRKQQKGQTVEIGKSGKAIPMSTEEVEALECKKNPEKVSPIKQHICGQCNQQFATAKTLGVHQRSVHNNERTIFPCPICETKFLSMWAAVKHLHRYHKKSKVQRERLRKVIRKNSYKKILTEAEEGAVQKAAEDMEKKEEEEEDEEEETKSSDSEIPVYKTKTVETQDRTQENDEKMDMTHEDGENDDNESKVEEISKQKEMDTEYHSDKTSPNKSSKKKEMDAEYHSDKTSPIKIDTDSGCLSRRSPEHECFKCDRKFNNSVALTSHGNFCSLTPMVREILSEGPLSPRVRSETPEKKIAIQIRKDYKKNSTPNKVFDEIMPQQVIFKVPKTPGEMKVESMLTEFCDLPKLFCMPCKKTYKSITSLKRHASQHFTWTRFMCQKCNLRTFHRYECVRHVIIHHKFNEAEAHNVVVDHEEVGALKYHLINDDESCISSDTEDSESVSSIHSPVQCLSLVYEKEIKEESIHIWNEKMYPTDDDNKSTDDDTKEFCGFENSEIERKRPDETPEEQQNIENKTVTNTSVLDNDEHSNSTETFNKETCGTEIIEIEENRIDKIPKNQQNIDGTEIIEIEENRTNKITEEQQNIESKTVTNAAVLNVEHKSMETSINYVPNITSSSSIQNNLELDSLSKSRGKTLRKNSLLSVIQNLQEKVKLEHTNGDLVLGESIYSEDESDLNTRTNGISDSDEQRTERPIRNRKSVEKRDFIYSTSPRNLSVVEIKEETPKTMSKRKQSFSPQIGKPGRKKQSKE